MEERQVRWIQEDLERTRKLAACGVVGRDALARALLPLLPLQYQPVLKEYAVTERLRRRIAAIAPDAAGLILDATVPPEDVVTLLRPTR